MKKLLYGFIFSLMLFSYADAQIATDQVYGGVYTKAETENKIADGVDEATALIVTSFDGFLTAADDTVQKALDTIDNLKSIIYTKTEVDSTIETAIEAALAAIPAANVNQTVTVMAGEALTAGKVVSLINESGTMKAYNQALAVSTSPNGAESVFNAAATTYCSAVALDSTRFATAYAHSDGTCIVKIGTVSGTSISYGSGTVVRGGATSVSSISIVLADADRLAVFVNSGTSIGFCAIVTVSGTTPTYVESTLTNFASATCSSISAVKVDTNKILVCYRLTGSTFGTCVYVTAPTGTGSFAIGSEATFNAATTSYISVSALSTTSAIVAYQDGGNSNYGTAQILSISGTTITPGTEYVFSGTTATTYTSVAAISATQAVITYEAGGGNTVVATNSSGTLSYGTPATFTDGQYNSTAKIDSTHVIIASQVAATNLGQSIIGTVSGTGITLGTAYSYNAAESTYNSVCYLGSNKSAIAYTDVGSSSYGTAVVNTWATTSYASVAGLSSGAYSAGSDAVVLIGGSYDGLSSLIPGSPYFVNSSFELQTTPVSLTSTIYSNAATAREIHFGTAKSSTEIILGIDYK